jgi:hypothetical protein
MNEQMTLAMWGEMDEDLRIYWAERYLKVGYA